MKNNNKIYNFSVFTKLNAHAGDGSYILEMNYVTAKMFKMKFTLLITALVVATCYAETDTDTYWSKFIADLWLEGADVLRIIWRDCSKKVSQFI